MIVRSEFHPHLRRFDDTYLEMRSSWFNFFFPAAERISWWGDIQLRCREEDYQHVLNVVPCATTTDANGNGRYCALAGADLDAYRVEVARWLSCFNERGEQIKTWIPRDVHVTVEPTIVAGPAPIKQKASLGEKLSRYLRRGKP